MSDLEKTIVNALVERIDELQMDDDWIIEQLHEAELDPSIANENEVKHILRRYADVLSEYV